MKIFNKTSIAAIVLAATLGTGNANAFTLDSLPEIGSSNINVVIRDGVATISGQTDDFFERDIAERHIQKRADVDRVINLITFQ